MTKPKPKPIGSAIDVPDGALVIRPGATEADARRIAGGLYVFDVPGIHVVDGTEYEAADPDTPETV